MEEHHARGGLESEREADPSILGQIEVELADVERALARLDDGSYGTCQACGGPIAEERLEAMPATRFCVRHQPFAATSP